MKLILDTGAFIAPLGDSDFVDIHRHSSLGVVETGLDVEASCSTKRLHPFEVQFEIGADLGGDLQFACVPVEWLDGPAAEHAFGPARRLERRHHPRLRRTLLSR